MNCLKINGDVCRNPFCAYPVTFLKVFLKYGTILDKLQQSTYNVPIKMPKAMTETSRYKGNRQRVAGW